MLLHVPLLQCRWIDSCCDIDRGQPLILCNVHTSQCTWPLALSYAFRGMCVRCILKSVNLLVNNESVLFSFSWKHIAMFPAKKKKKEESFILLLRAARSVCDPQCTVQSQGGSSCYKAVAKKTFHQAAHLFQSTRFLQTLHFILFFIICVLEYFTTWHLDIKTVTRA